MKSCNCPKCKSTLKLDTDTLDTFVDSSWYFLRYFTPNDTNKAFDESLVNKYGPVSMYLIP